MRTRASCSASGGNPVDESIATSYFTSFCLVCCLLSTTAIQEYKATETGGLDEIISMDATSGTTWPVCGRSRQQARRGRDRPQGGRLQDVFLGWEEVDRFRRRNRFDIFRLEAEQLDSLHEFVLEFFVTKFAGYDFAERNDAVRCDR